MGQVASMGSLSMCHIDRRSFTRRTCAKCLRSVCDKHSRPTLQGITCDHCLRICEVCMQNPSVPGRKHAVCGSCLGGFVAIVPRCKMCRTEKADPSSKLPFCVECMKKIKEKL